MSAPIIRIAKIAQSRWGADKYFRLYEYIIGYLVEHSPTNPILKRLALLLPGISDARFLGRLNGLFETYYYMTLDDDWKLQAQGYSMLVYYPLEYLYLLGTKGVIRLKNSTITALGVNMCRMWLLYITIDLYKNWRQYKKKKLDKVDFIRNAGDFVMAAHWSTYSGLISEKHCKLFGIVSSIAGMKQLWEANQ